MSFPYPQDRARERREKGEQPYQDAKEAMAQGAAQIQTEAEAAGEARRGETDAELAARLAADAEDRLAEVNRQVADESDSRPD